MRKNSSIRFIFVFFVLGAVGCATSSKKSTQDSVDWAGTYTEGVRFTLAGQLSGATCSVPPAHKSTKKVGNGPSKIWQDLVGRAGACAKTKNWVTMETIANEMTRIDLFSPWGAYFLSVSAVGQGDFPRALWMVELAQKKAKGRKGIFHYQKGRVLMEMKETAKAMSEFSLALKEEPDLIEGHLVLADIHLRDFEFSEATRLYQEALRRDQKNFRALSGLAEALLAQDARKVSEAATLYGQAVTEHPSLLQPRLRLAYLQENLMKNQEGALETYKGLKSAMRRGVIKEKTDFDYDAKIKELESEIQTRRLPAGGKKS